MIYQTGIKLKNKQHTHIDGINVLDPCYHIWVQDLYCVKHYNI